MGSWVFLSIVVAAHGLIVAVASLQYTRPLLGKHFIANTLELGIGVAGTIAYVLYWVRVDQWRAIYTMFIVSNTLVFYLGCFIMYSFAVASYNSSKVKAKQLVPRYLRPLLFTSILVVTLASLISWILVLATNMQKYNAIRVAALAFGLSLLVTPSLLSIINLRFYVTKTIRNFQPGVSSKRGQGTAWRTSKALIPTGVATPTRISPPLMISKPTLNCPTTPPTKKPASSSSPLSSPAGSVSNAVTHRDTVTFTSVPHRDTLVTRSDSKSPPPVVTHRDNVTQRSILGQRDVVTQRDTVTQRDVGSQLDRSVSQRGSPCLVINPREVPIRSRGESIVTVTVSRQGQYVRRLIDLKRRLTVFLVVGSALTIVSFIFAIMFSYQVATSEAQYSNFLSGEGRERAYIEDGSTLQDYTPFFPLAIAYLLMVYYVQWDLFTICTRGLVTVNKSQSFRQQDSPRHSDFKSFRARAESFRLRALTSSCNAGSSLFVQTDTQPPGGGRFIQVIGRSVRATSDSPTPKKLRNTASVSFSKSIVSRSGASKAYDLPKC
ncbi:hypothetical protein AAMO2058_000875200 [Amorphochlora amoebiformis]